VTRRLEVAADLTHLAQVRQFVAAAATALGAPPAATDDLVLAVDEWMSNVIVHGYAGRAGQIEIEVAPAPGAVQVIVSDTAPPFDPTQLPDPDINLPLELRPVGGLGAYLMRQLVNAIQHQTTAQGGNRLTLTKRFTPLSSGAGEAL
jgi:serine/threonine-protein kinase RsbW